MKVFVEPKKHLINTLDVILARDGDKEAQERINAVLEHNKRVAPTKTDKQEDYPPTNDTQV